MRRRFWPLWLLVCACLVWPAAPVSAGVVRHFLASGADAVSIDLPKSGQKLDVERTGEREITVTLPPALAKRAAAEKIALDNPGLISDVKVAGQKLVVTFTTNEIGYIAVPKGKAFTVQFYSDPLGARFAPPPGKPGKDTPPAKPDKPGKDAAKGKPPAAADSQDKTEADLMRSMAQAKSQAAAPSAPADKPPPVDVSLPPAPQKPQTQEPKTPPLPPGTAEPFFGVGGVYRAKIVRGGPPPASGPAEAAPGAAMAPAQPPAQTEQPAVAAGQAQPGQPDKAATMPGPVKPPAEAKAPPPAGPQPAQPAQPAAPVASQAPAAAQAQLPATSLPADEIEYGSELRAKVSQARPGEAPGPLTLIGQSKPPAKPVPQAQQPGLPQEAASSEPAKTADSAKPAEPGAAEQAKPAEQAEAKPEAATPAQSGGEKKPAEAEPEPGHGKKTKKAEDDEQIQVRLAEAQNLEMAGELLAAAQIYDSYVHQPGLDPEDVSEALYKIASLLYRAYSGDLATHYMAVNNAFQKALSSYPKSRWIPLILASLGELNLKVGNVPEAMGYFTLLKQRYPSGEELPLINFYWGEYYLGKGEYRRASEEFQALINQFPESDHVKEAAAGLIKAFVKMSYYKEAAKIVDYVEKRWPRYYLDDPAFLLVSAEVAYRLEQYPRAKKLYLQYYNILPKSEGIDLVLARLGDVYLRQGEKVLAKQLYDRVIDNYPKSDGAQIAKMRLAEEGVFDDPSIAGMNALFSRPRMGSAGDVYREILDNYPDSSLAPLAMLKLALWQLFAGKNTEGLATAYGFLTKYKGGDLQSRAIEIASEGLNLAVAKAMGEKDYKAVVKLWDGYPLLTGPEGKVAGRTRLAAAYSLLKEGKAKESLEIAKPFISEQQSELGDIAFGLVLRIYYESQAWPQILELAKNVQTYKLNPGQRRDLDYALALAYENMADTAQSRPLWAKLASDTNLPDSKRALALYYNALSARDAPDPERALANAQQAYSLFESTKAEPQRIRDSLALLIDLYRSVGRLRDAVRACDQFAKLVDEGGLDWAANQFKMASIYRELGDMASWQAALESVTQKAPKSNYADMAASSLKAFQLERAADRLRGKP